jgi:NADH:ubiquinone oxidoreductase subunit C
MLLPVDLQQYLIYTCEKFFAFIINNISVVNNKIVKINYASQQLTRIAWCMRLSSFWRVEALSEIVLLDRIDLKPRYLQINHVFNSYSYNYKLIFQTFCSYYESPQSLSTIFINSSWSEREAREMFGCRFTGMQDDRRLLTDYGFTGFCLRKDFPLSGYVEVRYDDELMALVVEPLELSQDFRLFITKSSWETNN